jgi:hypothetical protein
MTESDGYVLLALFLVPLGTSALLMLVPSRERSIVIGLTAISSLAMFVMALYVFLSYSFNGDQFQGVLAFTWMENVGLLGQDGIQIKVGVDGIAASLVLLTGIVVAVLVYCVLVNIGFLSLTCCRCRRWMAAVFLFYFYRMKARTVTSSSSVIPAWACSALLSHGISSAPGLDRAVRDSGWYRPRGSCGTPICFCRRQYAAWECSDDLCCFDLGWIYSLQHAGTQGIHCADGCIFHYDYFPSRNVGNRSALPR